MSKPRLRLLYRIVMSALALVAAGFAIETARTMAQAAELRTPPRSAARREPTPPPPVPRDKDGAGLVTRNPLCSTCQPAPATPPPATPPAHRLTGLTLIATDVGGRADFAVVRDDASHGVARFVVGDALPGGAVVFLIERDRLTARSGDQLEVLGFGGLIQAPEPKPEPKPQPLPRQVDALAAELDAGIHSKDGAHFEIDQGLYEKLLTDTVMLSRQAFVVPENDGFLLKMVRPGGVFEKLGLVSGDVLQAVNGIELTNPMVAMDAFIKLRHASNFSLTIARGGKPSSLSYSVR